ncbi:MAG: hypothetical protein VX498_01870, partial [Myxococcota bacterium]|nr:hypothetical protein [Myxococcota bacterium]
FVSFSLVDEVANESNEGSRGGLASRFRFFRQLHGELRPDRRFPRFRSIEELEAFGLDLCDQGRHLEHQMMDPAQELPQPPFPGEAPVGQGGLLIQPLSSVREVIRHASEMRNCLARSPSHMRPMLSGEAAAYAVKWNEPETGVELKATAFLEQVLPGSWELTDIALKRNQPSPPVLTQKVFNWVSRHNAALSGDRPFRGSLGSEFAHEEVDPRQLPFPWCSCQVHAKCVT